MHSEHYNKKISKKSCLDTRCTCNNELYEIVNIWFEEGFKKLKDREDIERKTRYESTILFLLKSPDYRKELSDIISNWPYCELSKSDLHRLLLLSDPKLERN